MKTNFVIAVFAACTSSLFAQNSLESDFFRLAIPSGFPSPCYASASIGKIFMEDNKLMFCTDVSTSLAAYSFWKGENDIYYNGNVGISNGTPTSSLHTIEGRGTSWLVGEKIGVGTITPTEKVEVKDGKIRIENTTDDKKWTWEYESSADRLTLTEMGAGSRLMVTNDGNVGISLAPSNLHKLTTSTLLLTGDLTVEGGGVMRSTHNFTPDKMFTSTFVVGSGSTFTINANDCNTVSFTFPMGSGYSAAPSVAVGQRISGGTADEKLIISTQTVSATGATAKFCNTTASNISLSNYTYSYMVVGQ
jgi:hypothetical protein